jgi:hypothetical protein
MTTTIDTVDTDALEEISWRVLSFQQAARAAVTENIPSVLEDALNLLKETSNIPETNYLNQNQRCFIAGVNSALYENHANPLAFVRAVKVLAHEPGQP